MAEIMVTPSEGELRINPNNMYEVQQYTYGKWSSNYYLTEAIEQVRNSPGNQPAVQMTTPMYAYPTNHFVAAPGAHTHSVAWAAYPAPLDTDVDVLKAATLKAEIVNLESSFKTLSELVNSQQKVIESLVNQLTQAGACATIKEDEEPLI